MEAGEWSQMFAMLFAAHLEKTQQQQKKCVTVSPTDIHYFVLL